MKQPEALTLAQKLENAPAWESQSPTIYGWNDSGETLADAAAELRRLHSDYETLLTGYYGARLVLLRLQAQLESADDRLRDMLLADDGQADEEARKYLERRAQPYDQQAMGLCHVCGWKGVIDYPDGPVCVACEHDKTLSPQPTAQAQHPDDAAVEKLAESMKQKLAEKRAQGRSGWDTDCTQQRLSDLLRQHVEKGDVLDVANFCAFLFARGERVSAAQAATATLQEKETND